MKNKISFLGVFLFISTLVIGQFLFLPKSNSVQAVTINSSQTIQLTTGWNHISFNIVPEDLDMQVIFQPLIDEGSLEKVQDEQGYTLENVIGVWHNNIGLMDVHEGYQVKVNKNTSLTINGQSTDMDGSWSISLTAGYNMMGYPTAVEHNAYCVLRPLIDNGSLIKVVDANESPIFYSNNGFWVNKIGNMQPGHGYYIKVSKDTTVKVDDQLADCDWSDIAPSAIDSDNGQDYYTQGICQSESNNYAKEIDQCDGSSLVEYYISQSSDDKGICSSEVYECPNGCSDGACIVESSTKTCSDLKSDSSNTQYFEMCKNYGYEYACFNKYTGDYQGCVKSNIACGSLKNSTDSSDSIKCGTGAPIFEIKNIIVKNITYNSADITWKTTVAGDSHVDYVKSPGTIYDIKNKKDDQFVTDHSIALTDLIPNTLYKYSITSSDENGNVYATKSLSSSELGLHFTTPPINNCTTEYDPICATNGKTYSNLCYAALDNATLYYYGKCRADCQEITEFHEAPTGNKYWETLGTDPSVEPDILKYKIQWFNGEWSNWYYPGHGDLDWKTNLDGSERLVWSYFDDHNHKYLKCVKEENDSTEKPDLKVDSIDFAFSDPQPGKKSILIIGFKNDGEVSTSFDFTINAAGAVLKEKTSRSSFTKLIRPGQTKYYHTYITYEKSGTYTIEVTVDPEDVVDELDETNNVKYKTVNVEESDDEEIVKPKITEHSVSSITDNSATINWQTNISTTGKVYYKGVLDKKFIQHTDNTSAGTNHSVELVDLNPGTKYYYFILATGDKSSVAYPANGHFKTTGDSGINPIIEDKIIDKVDKKLAKAQEKISKIAKRLQGRLLLATENHGRVYYVNPNNSKRYEITFGNLMNIFRKLSLGISNQDLNTIPINPASVNEDQDSDGDGFNDKLEVLRGYDPYIPSNTQVRGNDKIHPRSKTYNRLKGRILLQAEDRGQIWYVDQEGKRWQVTWNNAMNLFRKLSLGINNQDLSEIEEEE